MSEPSERMLTKKKKNPHFWIPFLHRHNNNRKKVHFHRCQEAQEINKLNTGKHFFLYPYQSEVKLIRDIFSRVLIILHFSWSIFWYDLDPRWMFCTPVYGKGAIAPSCNQAALFMTENDLRLNINKKTFNMSDHTNSWYLTHVEHLKDLNK